jgi:hypothetical protein
MLRYGRRAATLVLAIGLMLAHMLCPSHAFSVWLPDASMLESVRPSMLVQPFIIVDRTRRDVPAALQSASPVHSRSSLWGLSSPGRTRAVGLSLRMSADSSSEKGPGNSDRLGLPKSVQSELSALSAEEQNMILGVVGLAPQKSSKKKKAKSGRNTGAGVCGTVCSMLCCSCMKRFPVCMFTLTCTRGCYAYLCVCVQGQARLQQSGAREKRHRRNVVLQRGQGDRQTGRQARLRAATKGHRCVCISVQMQRMCVEDCVVG